MEILDLFESWCKGEVLKSKTVDHQGLKSLERFRLWLALQSKEVQKQVWAEEID